ncbi:STAS domain-containing protein [Bacillus songklensis]|uniref:STAS domain-containing protein n=1 Tax=Bacillus songklensis TaxID=1069116 RepID=A0ABV8B6Y8_9BACI
MLSIFISRKKRLLTIKLEGCLSDYLGREIDLINLSQNSSGIVINLSGVSYIDSTGLVDLLNWSIEANHRNLSIFFKGVSMKCWNKLQTLGLSEIVCSADAPITIASGELIL